jgi:hypothetical protein
LRWPEQPIRLGGRAGALLPCMEHATCDEGPNGIQARIVELTSP